MTAGALRRWNAAPAAHRFPRPNAAGAASGSKWSPVVNPCSLESVPYPTLLHRVFETHAARAPDAHALATRDATVSYDALNVAANRLARHLRMCGVAPDALVAICMQRTPTLFEAVLAVLKAGGAYVPLDPNYPEERLAQMLSDARPSVVLTDAASADALRAAMTRAGRTATTIDVGVECETWSSQSSENLSSDDAGLTPQHLAYVIYTSGSTGTPKGVMIEHGGLTHLLQAQTATFDVDADARVLQFASFSFDACVFEWVMAFGHGACLCLGAPGMPPIGDALVAAIDAHRITHATIPPVALSTLPHDAALPSLRVLISAGEALPPVLMRRWSRGRRMFNAYGPTETTVWCTVHACDPDAEDASVPIGCAIPGATAYALDEHRRPVADGELGELYVGGAGLARGYLHRPELTAERFVDQARDGERLYRTGDVVRRRPDGALEYHGRNDSQVKIRGFRIELGEIESALTRLNGIEEAAVVARDDDSGPPRLIAYVLATADRDVTAQTLRATLAGRLPDYMVPAAYVRMTAWPQTPNGKLDRRALPAPRPEDFASAAYVEPEGDTETALAAIWCELLAIERVGRDDRFLDLGGNSLKTIQLATRIRACFGREMPVDALFKAPSLRTMAAAIDAQPTHAGLDVDAGAFDAWNDAAPDALADPVRDPVSYQQHGLWLLEQVTKTSLAYNAQNVIRIRGEIDPELLQRAVDCVIERHEIFRTTFHDDGSGQQYQRVHPSAPGVLQTQALSDDADEAALQATIDAHVAYRFDLTRLPLVRLTLIRRGPADYVLIHVEQHYVHDGWSANLFMREMLDAYAAYARGETPALPPVPAQYRDYARWQRSEGAKARYAKHLAFWTAQVADVPHTLALPTDRPRPDEPSYAGTQLRCELPPEMASALRRFCAAEGFTLYAAMHAVYQIVLRAAGGTDTFLIGSAVANRRSRKSEGMLGMFVNMIPIRADVSGNPSYRELLDRTTATLSASYEHEELPFEWLVRAVRPERTTGHNPLFQTAFSAHNSDLPNLRRSGFELSMFEAYSNRTSKFDFDVVMLPRGQAHADSVTLLWNFATDLFETATIERLRDAYLRVLAQCLADPDRRLQTIETMAPDDRARLLEGGYREAPFDTAYCLHHAFEAHADRAPDAHALATRDATVNYGALNADANRLARHLRGCGVGPDALVAICMQRTPALFEAVLAVLKAGGAYVPLDPNYPEERLAQMLSDARPSVVLTDEASADALRAAMMRAGHAATTIDFGNERETWSSQSSENLSSDDVGLTSRHLAYVIYTSGSTGTPKGAMIEHRGAMNMLRAQSEAFAPTTDSRVLQFASLSFDACVFEWVMAFGHGACLCLAPPGEVLVGEALMTAIDDYRITHTILPPVALSTLPDTASLPSLRVLIAGGEALPPALMRRWARGRTMFNAYGPTETTVWCTLHACDPTADDSSVPIGAPLANHRVYVLDAQRRPVPVGVVGELYVGGVGVARGYLNRPELTAERFVDDPFRPGERLYRTGDLGRWRADGAIEYRGRNDFQVKIRGYRIELGEIESALTDAEDVKEAVVLAREDAPGMKRLVGYYRTQSGASLPSEHLREALRARLPEYMVPSAYVHVAVWPQTANAKLDRNALPAPCIEDAPSDTYVAPETPIESALAELWARALGVERVGMRDDFFRSGGYSVLGLRLILSINEAFGTQLSLRDLFRHPTAEGMLEAIYASVAEDETALA